MDLDPGGAVTIGWPNADMDLALVEGATHVKSFMTTSLNVDMGLVLVVEVMSVLLLAVTDRDPEDVATIG